MLKSSDLPFSERTAPKTDGNCLVSNSGKSDTYVAFATCLVNTQRSLSAPGEILRLKFEGGAIHPGLRQAELREWRPTQIVHEVTDGLRVAVGAARPILEKTADVPKVGDQDRNVMANRGVSH